MGMELVQTPTGGVAFNHDNSGARNSIIQTIAGIVNRAPTNTAIIGVLPANAQITRINISTYVVSNAATTATVSIGLSGGSATAFTTALDVKTSAVQAPGVLVAAWAPSTSNQTLTCTYTETGAASTAGTIGYSVEYTIV